MYLIPRSIGKHASKEGVHVTSIHGLAVLLDALSISKDQALPQQGITLPELICDLPAGGTQLRTDPRSKCTDHLNSSVVGLREALSLEQTLDLTVQTT